MLSKQSVDAVVTDMKMPGAISGRALYEWIQQHQPELANRMIFTMSDATHDAATRKLIESGVTFIQKPFEVEAFWNAVQRTLRQGQPAEAAR